MMTDNRLLLCIHAETQEQIQMAFDYRAGSEKDGEWVWAEPVKEIASRYNLKDSALLQKVRGAATAFDLSTRCSSGGHDIPREVSSRSDLAVSSRREFLCSECTERLLEQRIREEEERAKALISKQRAFLASLVAQATTIDYASVSYADAVAVYSIMLASDRACESGRLEKDALKLYFSDAMNDSFVEDLFTKGFLAVCDDSPLECIEVFDRGIWRYEPSRINWRLAEDSCRLPFSDVFEKVGKLIDQREAHVQFDDSVSDFWWNIAVDDALHFLISEVRKFRFPEYQCGQKTEKAVRYALEFYSIPQVRNLIRRSVGYAAQLSAARNRYVQHPFSAIPGLIIGNVDRAQSSNWDIRPILSGWDEETLLVRILFDRVLRTGLQGFRETSGATFAFRQAISSPRSGDETGRPRANGS